MLLLLISIRQIKYNSFVRNYQLNTINLSYKYSSLTNKFVNFLRKPQNIARQAGALFFEKV